MLRTGVISPWDEASLENMVILQGRLIRSRDSYHEEGYNFRILRKRAQRTIQEQLFFSKGCKYGNKKPKGTVTWWYTVSRGADAQFGLQIKATKKFCCRAALICGTRTFTIAEMQGRPTRCGSDFPKNKNEVTFFDPQYRVTKTQGCGRDQEAISLLWFLGLYPIGIFESFTLPVNRIVLIAEVALL
jgi:hypothetical protein